MFGCDDDYSTHKLFTSSVTVNFHSLQGSVMWEKRHAGTLYPATCMAPLCLDTSPHSGGQLTSGADGQAIIDSFIHEVANKVPEISKNEVYPVDLEIFVVKIFSWFAQTAKIKKHEIYFTMDESLQPEHFSSHNFTA